MKQAERIAKIIRTLRKSYPDSKCSLTYSTPFQLLASTILSAQCTDKRVNEVTPHLFKKFPDAPKMADAKLSELEEIIKSTGFFRQKSKSLKGMATILTQDYAGKLPQNIDELIQLPGTGRKTANVVLGNAFNKPAGVVVDTHVKRICNLLGLTKEKDPEKIEKDLNKKIPQKNWVIFSHWLIDHGRKVCIARRPQCAECPLKPYCPQTGLKKGLKVDRSKT